MVETEETEIEELEGRVGEENSFIGKYVVEVSELMSYEGAVRMRDRMNEMVDKREGIKDRFSIAKMRNDYQVVRKLIVGDRVEFINTNILRRLL